MTSTLPHRQLSDRHAILRDMIVESSLDLLDRNGLGLGVDAITYTRVFDHIHREHGIRITRGSVHGRIWPKHDDYRDEVLVAAISHSLPHEDSRAIHEAILEIVRAVDAFDLDRRGRVTAFCRIAGQAVFNGYLGSSRYQRFQAIKAVARGRPGDSATTLLQSMIGEKADGNMEARAKAFGLAFRALGLRARSDLDISNDQAATTCLILIQTLMAGAHLDHHAGYTAMASMVETDLPTTPDQPWTYFGIGFLAAVDLLFEPDPDAEPGDFDYRSALDALEPSPLAHHLPEATTTAPDLSNQNRRRSRQELRDLLVATGEQLLLRDGIGLTPRSLTYAAVFEHVQESRAVTVHRSSVHPHIWTSQDEFQADILAEAARYHVSESLNTARQAMAAQSAIRNPDGSVNLRQMILDSTLAVVMAQMLVSANSSSFRRWQSIKAAMLSRDAEKQFSQLRQAISDRYEDLIVDFVETYRTVLPIVGLHVNPELQISDEQAYHLFAVLGAAYTSGADYNITAGSTAVAQTVTLPRTDGSGDTDDWPIQALASLSILDLLFVPTPNT